MDDLKTDLKTYETINKKNEELIEKKNQLEFILNRYHQVITKIEPGDDDEENILIETVKEVFKKGNGNINNLIDTYLKNLQQSGP
tara:strand:- start:159 stop:413 length:255 start_codon:yes stop_codon:yes gene_type:complete